MHEQGGYVQAQHNYDNEVRQAVREELIEQRANGWF